MAFSIRPFHVLALILAIRLSSVFVVQTWYVPDEYWQSLEVAHKLAFGYGALTWEWERGIRNYLHPTIIAGFYKVLELLKIDYPQLVVLGPRFLQALLSSAADYAFYKWSGERKWALFIWLTSWFWYYMATRTLINTVETALITIGLSIFPFKGGKMSAYTKEDNRWIWLAAYSCDIRPTAVIIWLPLCLYHLFTTNQDQNKLIALTYMPIALISLSSLTALDTYLHGSLVVTPWEFIKFNVYHDIGSFYGTSPWYWYLAIGLPAVLGINLLPFLAATYQVLRHRAAHHTQLLLLAIIAFTIVVYSALPHKEFRFILPLLPMVSYMVQDRLVTWSRKASTMALYAVAASLLVGNLLPAAYLSQVHQRGALDLMPHLRHIAQDKDNSILILTPCHSTPLYSHIHVNTTIKYLTCKPDFTGKIDYIDEAELFFHNPERWFTGAYARVPKPTHLVFYDVLLPRIENVLVHYRHLQTVFHTEYPEGRVGANFLIYQKTSKPKPTAGRTQADEAV